MEEIGEELSQASTDTEKLQHTPDDVSPKPKDKLVKTSSDKKRPSTKSKEKKISKTKATPLSKEDSPEKMKEKEPDLATDLHSEDEPMSEGTASQTSRAESEAQSISKGTDSIVPKEDTQPVETKKEEKMTMDEKIAAKKAKKAVKEEEPVFAGMKLKKSKPLQRQWTEQELETVQLKDHQFEQLAQIETVILIY